MDAEQLVRRAQEGDVGSFVALTQRFQHLAFGSALAMLGDFQQAQDTVQKAFLAAWLGLPSLSDGAAFPGWLRGVVRHHAFRALRRRQLEVAPLDGMSSLTIAVPGHGPHISLVTSLVQCIHHISLSWRSNLIRRCEAPIFGSI